MRKELAAIVLIIFNVLLITKVQAETLSEKLDNCTPYIHDNGSKIVQIVGWSNRKCLYREFTTQRSVDCNFKQVHIDMLKKEMAQKSKYVRYNALTTLETFKEFTKNPLICTVKNQGEEQ